MPRFPRVSTHTVYSAVLGFWPAELSRSESLMQRQSHLQSAPLRHSNYSWPCDTQVPSKSTPTPHHFTTSCGPDRQLQYYSTGQKPYTAIYLTFTIITPTNKSHTWRHILLKRSLFLWPHWPWHYLLQLSSKRRGMGGGSISNKTSFYFRYKCIR
jgi:hypothetical protein